MFGAYMIKNSNRFLMCLVSQTKTKIKKRIKNSNGSTFANPCHKGTKNNKKQTDATNDSNN